MALTKLPKSAFGTGSVDDTKIEDGTIQNQELAGSLSEDKIATGTIANASLSNSSITINGTSISLGGSSSVGVDVNWQSVITADGSTFNTASAGNGYFIDTTSAAHTINLPASASLGDQIAIKDYAGTFSSNNLTIGRNGHNIQGVANDSLISTNRASLLLVYVDSTKGWIYAEESNVADLQLNTFISATGGTITTTGDYKIHTFTGDSCFAVSTIGAGASGGPSVVDYLVVAGGGGGAANGGGGAGGYRESHSTCVSGPYTASPLATPTGITVSATTYPITVGGGGTFATRSGATSAGLPGGSPSAFSTITSAGGGRGGCGCYAGRNGGSGGGASHCRPVGSGNTPPVSPPQGQNGGPGTGGGGGGGGAGGTGSAGGAYPGGNGGAGGTGVTTNITTSPVAYAGGGGGGGCAYAAPNPGGAGGSGGGGTGGTSQNPAPSVASQSGTAGSANTGGGGGGAGYSVNNPTDSNGGSGGSGLVIIRYKFQ
jgi:hypothetical protein